MLELGDWKDDYNTVRPHSAIGNLAPAIHAKLSVSVMQRAGGLELFEGPRQAADQTRGVILLRPCRVFSHRNGARTYCQIARMEASMVNPQYRGVRTISGSKP